MIKVVIGIVGTGLVGLVLSGYAHKAIQMAGDAMGLAAGLERLIF